MRFHHWDTIYDFQLNKKICKGDFIDVLPLLPSHKDFMIKLDKKGDEKQKEDRRKPIPTSFHNWQKLITFFFAFWLRST